MARPLSITLEIEANELRRRIALGDTAPVDTRKALQQLGVLCVFMPMQETFSGMCLKHKENRFMLLNSKVALGRQHFTIAHELYHLFIQEEFSSQICPQSSSDPVEKQADCFATFFLMPRNGVIEEFKKLGMKYTADVNIAHVLYLQQYFGVSFQSMIYRLNNLTLISDKQKETFLLYQPTAVAREYGYSTSLYTPTNEKIVLGDYSAKAQSLFNKELISEGHLIDLLSEIKLDE